MTAIGFEGRGSTYLSNIKIKLSLKSPATDNGPRTSNDVSINNVYIDKVEHLEV